MTKPDYVRAIDDVWGNRGKRYRGFDHNPRWVHGQLCLGVYLLGWRYIGKRWVNPKTGESCENEPRKIISQLIGREV